MLSESMLEDPDMTVQELSLLAFGLPTTLPKLEVDWYGKGGIFDKPSIIGVGEKGREAVVPLSKNSEWMQEQAKSVADKVAERSAQISQYQPQYNMDAEPSGGNWTIVLQKQDGTVEQQFTITAAERQNRRSGKTIIAI